MNLVGVVDLKPTLSIPRGGGGEPTTILTNDVLGKYSPRRRG